MTGKRSEFGTLTERAEATRRHQAGTGPEPPDIPAANNASVSSRRVKTRFVLVSRNDQKLPGLVLEWAKVQFVWTARVAYVTDDNGTMMVEWLHADRLTPLLTAEQ